MQIKLGIFGIIAMVFVVLKLTDTITWSWWWVLSPLWVPFTLGLITLGVLYLISNTRW